MRSAAATLICAMLVLGSEAEAQVDGLSSSTDRNKLVCKRHLDTGSIVRSTKRCFAKKDWDRIIDSQQRGARKLVEELTDRGGGR